MSQISFPYGKTVQTIDLPDDRLRGVLRSRMHAYHPAESEEALVAQALAQPLTAAVLRLAALRAAGAGDEHGPAPDVRRQPDPRELRPRRDLIRHMGRDESEVRPGVRRAAGQRIKQFFHVMFPLVTTRKT